MLPSWILPQTLPEMREKSTHRNVCIGDGRKYNLSAEGKLKRRNNLGDAGEAKRRESAKRAALTRWGRIPVLR